MIATLQIPVEAAPTADLIERLGGIPPYRIRMTPTPGTATADDLLAVNKETRTVYELIDGVMVEKATVFFESAVATCIIQHLREFVISRKLGLVAAGDGTLNVIGRQLRAADVSYVSWARMPLDYKTNPFPSTSPDLAVEVLSRTNTEAEMQIKRRQHFAGGTRLVWIVDPKAKTVRVYRPTNAELITLTQTDDLDGLDVLPGFRLPIAMIFSESDRPDAAG